MAVTLKGTIEEFERSEPVVHKLKGTKYRAYKISILPERGTDKDLINTIVFGGEDSEYPVINSKEVKLKVGDYIGMFYTIQDDRVKILDIKVIKEEESNMSSKLSKISTSTGTKDKFSLRGTIFYAHVKDKNTKGQYPSNAYQLDLSIDEAHSKKLKSLGVMIKNRGDDRGDFVTLKSKEYQPRIIGEEGEDLTGQILIGNGSIADVTTSLYDNSESNVKAGKGGSKMLGLGTIKLISLVSYSPEVRPLVE